LKRIRNCVNGATTEKTEKGDFVLKNRGRGRGKSEGSRRKKEASGRKRNFPGGDHSKKKKVQGKQGKGKGRLRPRKKFFREEGKAWKRASQKSPKQKGGSS